MLTRGRVKRFVAFLYVLFKILYAVKKQVSVSVIETNKPLTFFCVCMRIEKADCE